jgi:outer membrane protein assembly factor BamD (BamD/ComL family)
MKSALPGILRLISLFLLIGGIGLGVLDAYGAARMPSGPDETMSSRLPMLAQAVAIMLSLGGLAAILYGVAAIVESVGNETGVSPGLGQTLHRLSESMEKLRGAMEKPSLADSKPPTRAADIPYRPIAGADSMKQVISLLEEIRELALLNDAQRQQRLADTQKQRRDFLAGEFQRLLSRQDWAAAERALAALESEFPSDPALGELKSRIADGRQQAEQTALTQMRERVEDRIAINAWDPAFIEAAKFAENFPNNAEGKQLLARVIRERDIYVETTANRLYEEIKSDIEHRHWRRALATAKTLLERAPGHRRSASIRGQYKTIQENAEIEERQQQERRIQELVRAKQFPEAIDLAEDLLHRFPNSPQAGSLQELLPKMRELAIEKEIETEAE